MNPKNEKLLAGNHNENEILENAPENL